MHCDAVEASDNVPAHVTKKAAFTPKQNKLLRELATKLRRDNGWSQEDIASRLGMKQQSFSSFFTGRQGAGPATAAGLCKLAGTTVAELFGEAAVEAYRRGSDPYPNREVVTHYAQLMGLYRPALDRLQILTTRDRRDRPCEWWLRRAILYTDLLRDNSGVIEASPAPENAPP